MVTVSVITLSFLVTAGMCSSDLEIWKLCTSVCVYSFSNHVVMYVRLCYLFRKHYFILGFKVSLMVLGLHLSNRQYVKSSKRMCWTLYLSLMMKRKSPNITDITFQLYFYFIFVHSSFCPCER